MVQILNILGICLAITMPATAAPVSTTCASSPPGQGHSGIAMPAEFKKYTKAYEKNIRASLPQGHCTSANIAKRKSWDDLDEKTRLDYIRAVKCLAAKPALTDKTLAPGAVNRLDDLTYIHINQTNIIHSGYLFPWHRLFLWKFEEAMRNECNYKGYLPYWDNARFSEDPLSSAMWSGAPDSFGGNGIFLENDHGPYQKILPGLANPNFTLPAPAGTGGGCITNGPFVDFKISLGPVAKAVIDPSNKYGLKPNPRCLSRNFDPQSSIGVLTWANATTIVSSPNITALRTNVERLWHKNSHTFIGKEGADPFSTTNDPAFYLLHAQIDRLYGIWQGQDLKNREYATDGPRTFLGLPLDTAPNVPTSSVELDDVMDLGLGYKPRLKEGLPMTKGGMCYIYE